MKTLTGEDQKMCAPQYFCTLQLDFPSCVQCNLLCTNLRNAICAICAEVLGTNPGEETGVESRWTFSTVSKKGDVLDAPLDQLLRPVRASCGGFHLPALCLFRRARSFETLPDENIDSSSRFAVVCSRFVLVWVADGRRSCLRYVVPCQLLR